MENSTPLPLSSWKCKLNLQLRDLSLSHHEQSWIQSTDTHFHVGIPQASQIPAVPAGLQARSAERWILPPGVVDGGPSQDDADARVGAVQVEHGQSLLVRGPSDEEYNNVLRPGIKAQITEWFGLKGPKSSSHSQQDTLPCPAWPWTLSGMEQPQILSWDQTKPRINPAPRRQ